MIRCVGSEKDIDIQVRGLHYLLKIKATYVQVTAKLHNGADNYDWANRRPHHEDPIVWECQISLTNPETSCVEVWLEEGTWICLLLSNNSLVVYQLLALWDSKKCIKNSGNCWTRSRIILNTQQNSGVGRGGLKLNSKRQCRDSAYKGTEYENCKNWHRNAFLCDFHRFRLMNLDYLWWFIMEF